METAKGVPIVVDETIADEPVPGYSQANPAFHSIDRIQPLPIYTEHDVPQPLSINELRQLLFDPRRAKSQDMEIWQKFLGAKNSWNESDANVRSDQFIATAYFDAIGDGQEDVVVLLITSNIVTANTVKTSSIMKGETPLLRAVASKNIPMVQQLLALGADPNAFGCAVSLHLHPGILTNNLKDRSYERDFGMVYVQRTPLQLAASIGHLVLVKLLMEQYNCDDSLVAPDGQIALRLAAENGHSEVVEYLPARRGGGLRRWQYKNRKALRRAKRAGRKIFQFAKFFVWDIEYFFLWSVPKHLIVKPIMKGCNWCWANKKSFGPWCKHQVLAIPVRVKKFVEWIGRTSVKISKGLWKFFSEILPKMVKHLAVWVWKLVTVKIPRAVVLLAKWLAAGFTSLVEVVWNAILKVISFIATLLEAVVTFFRSLTLKDIWNGFCDVLRAVFVAFPKMLGSWAVAFGRGSYAMMKLLFGEIGEIIWYIGVGIGWLVTYLPRQLWRILESIGGVFARAGYELRVWFNPKAR